MKTRRIIWALIIIIIGVVWIANIYGWIDMQWIHNETISKIIIPALIILIGLSMLMHALRSKDRHNGWEDGDIKTEKATADMNKIQVMLAGRSITYYGQSFEKLSINTFMGGVRLDLRGAIISDDAHIKISTLMGGVEIYLDEDTGVVVQSNCMIGGVGDNRKNKSDKPVHIISIEANCLMGGVALKD